ncbi:GAF domain-containing sensor histidine kinase [Telluria aromaticivorans]|uniref:histidine kinase n=1 Tax=Telluria aromaticivorans TaxID=2725995 RepID=A0A7Y2NYI8_9BURK|nr:ATP-binding protein [Telluria aromaticivorans]NNG22857.1 GAF domain-containing sensor histidine kinase [Telluria aromaticivorans]
MADDVPSYVSEIQAIGAVPKILETVAAMTGLRFVCIAHVTQDSWTACAVLDGLEFGLKPGGALDVTTTLCEQVRDTEEAVIIDSVRDSARYHDHHTPRIYGFQSYFSIPVFRPGGQYFGTLCGLDPEPARLTGETTVSTLTLFAELISKQLEAEHARGQAQNELLTERETAELREQFIAVLGHDLRTPLSAIQSGAEILLLKHQDSVTREVAQRIRRCASRMAALVGDVVDFTRGRMGSGIALDLRDTPNADLFLRQVVDELCDVYPERQIDSSIEAPMQFRCDPDRLSQLLSNLLKNAVVHGDEAQPIVVDAHIDKGMFALHVVNGGPGLPADVVTQLFKPYWRAASRQGSEGLGLGLYIVDRIARGHHGTVAVNSADGVTEFIFTMPAA